MKFLRAILNIKANMDTANAQKELDNLAAASKRTADNIARAAKGAAMPASAMKAATFAGGTSSADGLNPGEHRVARSTAGTRGGAGRNFAGLAQSGGSDTSGVVAAYATLAANMFAITAGFKALSDAAKFDQLEKGLQKIGAMSGVTLSVTARGLKNVTDNAISTADAMRAVAQASAAGLKGEEINRLGMVAKGASVALGRDMLDSMDRLTRGVIKLEPELLDELGIMTRLDEASRVYALANNKTVSSLTQVEKRQAFLNAVLAEGEKKFGDIAKSVGANPYDKLLSAAKDTSTSILRVVTDMLDGPVKIFAQAPLLALLPLIGILNQAANKVIPNAASSFKKLSGEVKRFEDLRAHAMDNEYAASLEGNSIAFKKLANEAGLTKNVISTFADDWVVTGGEARKARKEIKLAIDAENQKKNSVLASNKSIEVKRIEIAAIDEQILKLRTLNELTIEQRALTRSEQGASKIANKFQSKKVFANQNASIMSEFGDASALGPISTIKAIGTAMSQAWRDGKENIVKVTEQVKNAEKYTKLWELATIRVKVGLNLVTMAGRLAFATISTLLPMIMIASAVVSGALAIYESFKSKEQKAKDAILKDLREINENASKVANEIDVYFNQQQYGKGFEAAIANLNTITEQLEKIKNIKVDKVGKQLAYNNEVIGESYQFKGFFDAIGTMAFGRLNPGQIYKKFTSGVSYDQGKGVETAISQIKLLGDVETAEAISAMKTYQEKEDAINSYNKGLLNVSKTWSTVSEETKKAAAALKKWKGKDAFDTDYTPFADSIKAIAVEIGALDNEALGAEERYKYLLSTVNEFARGGIETFQELDRLAGSTDYTQYARDLEILNRQIKKASEAGDKALVSSLEETIRDKTESLFSASNMAANSIRVQAESARNLIDSLLVRVGKANADIAEQIKTLESSAINRKFDLRRSGRNAAGLSSDLQDKQDDLNKQRELSASVNKTLTFRAELIALEFQLEEAKRAQLLSTERSTLDNLVQQLPGVTNASTGMTNGDELARYLDMLIDAGNGLAAPETLTALEHEVYQRGVALGLREKESELATRGQQLALDAIEDIKAQNRAQIQQARDTISAVDTEKARRADTLKIQERALANERETLKAAEQRADIETQIKRDKIDAARIRAGLPGIGTNDQITRQVEDYNTQKSRLGTDATATKKEFDSKIAELNAQIADLVNSGAGLTEPALINANNRAIADLQDQITNLTSANTQYTEGLTKQLEGIDASIEKTKAGYRTLATTIRDVTREVNDNYTQSKLLFTSNMLGTTESVKAMVAAEAERTGQTITQVMEGASMKTIQATAIALEQTKLMTEGINNISNAWQQGLGNAFTDIITGTKSVKQAFGDLAIGVLKAIAQMIAQMIALKITSLILGVPIPGAAGGVTGGAANHASANSAGVGGSNARPGAAGGIIPLANGGVMGRAAGGLQGVVKQPTYLVGEGKYNEAVVPLPNGRSIPVQMHGGSSATNNVQVNVNIAKDGTTQTNTEGPDMNQLGGAISEAVQKELMRHKMPGGLLSRYGAA